MYMDAQDVRQMLIEQVLLRPKASPVCMQVSWLKPSRRLHDPHYTRIQYVDCQDLDILGPERPFDIKRSERSIP